MHWPGRSATTSLLASALAEAATVRDPTSEDGALLAALGAGREGSAADSSEPCSSRTAGAPAAEHLAKALEIRSFDFAEGAIPALRIGMGFGAVSMSFGEASSFGEAMLKSCRRAAVSSEGFSTDTSTHVHTLRPASRSARPLLHSPCSILGNSWLTSRRLLPKRSVSAREASFVPGAAEASPRGCCKTGSSSSLKDTSMQECFA
mmetsp:Transcript_34795/g.75860  ORF Transcript_34795/g.75860 Transcript_34795/m.75860 type:complete len:205 (-) Transcript_34795:7-621(-)